MYGSSPRRNTLGAVDGGQSYASLFRRGVVSITNWLKLKVSLRRHLTYYGIYNPSDQEEEW